MATAVAQLRFANPVGFNWDALDERTRMTQVADEAKALGLRLLSRRWDDPPHTIETMDAAIAELAALRRIAVDSEDLQALKEVLAEITEMRRQLDA